MADAPPPSYSPSAPQILITPLSNRSSFLGVAGNVVEGEVFVKGLGLDAGAAGSAVQHRRRVESLSARVLLHDILPGFPSIPLFESTATIIYKASSTSPAPFSNSHTFSITLISPQIHDSHATLPGCVHLAEHEFAGEVRYDLEVLLRLRDDTPGGSASDQTVEEVRERQVIHITPRQSSASQAGSNATSNKGALAGQETVEAGTEIRKDDHGMRMRLILSGKSVKVGEALPVGVEIASMDPSHIQTTANTTTDPRGLRRVKVELWRRIRTPLPQTEYSNEPGPSSLVGSQPSFKDHLTLLWRSGKSCRYSATQPIRLLFHLPPRPTNNPVSSSLRGLSDAQCGEITQETPYHRVEFFVRAMAGFASSEEEVQLDKELIVQAPDQATDLYDADIPPPDTTAPPDVHRDEVLAQQLSYQDAFPHDDASRLEAYRRKGQDVVGDGGTYRADLPDVMQGSSSTPYHGVSSNDNPPPFSTDAPPPPFAAVTGVACPAEPNTVQEDGVVRELPSTISIGLPTFQESQSHAHLTRTATESTDRGELFTVRPATGELVNWIEYDGYESFSHPPPPAAASLGLNSSMDLPVSGEDQAIDSTLVRNLLGDAANSSGSGGDVRMRLMTELGLGEGTRVFDMQGDMPPGIDEPSLPALPHALMPHHIRQRQRSISHQDVIDGAPHDELAPPLEPFQASAHPPPSFAASEAAEAQGFPAGIPVSSSAVDPIPVGRDSPLETDTSSRQSHTPDHPPPLYTTGQAIATADLPPSYR